MANIKEKLSLEDNFTNGFMRFVQLADNAKNAVTNLAYEASDKMMNIGETMEGRSEVISRSAYSLGNFLNSLGLSVDGVDGAFQRFSFNLNHFKRDEDEAAKSTKTLTQSLQEMGQSRAGDILSHQMLRFTGILFGVRRLLRYFREAFQRLPEGIQESWMGPLNSLKNLFAGAMGGFLQGAQKGLDRLNAAFNSAGGQKFARGLETIFRGLGTAIGWIADKIGMFVEFLGNNFQTVFAIAIPFITIFAAKMLAAGAATVMANLPLIILVGLVAAVTVGLMKAGVTAEQIGATIGAVFGGLYAFIGNGVVTMYNAFASFAEFIANVFNDPVGAALNLFYDLADGVLSTLENIAHAIDKIFGSNLAGTISGWRAGMEQWRAENLTENAIKFDRMEAINYDDAIASFSAKGANFANSLSNFSLANAVAVPLSDISSDTSSISGSAGKIANAVSDTNEELKSLVDMAERQYVNNINLTSQTPIITINGQNTGNSEADRRALVEMIRDELLTQASSTSIRSTAMP